MANQILSKFDTQLTMDYIIHAKESVIFERKWVFKPDGSIWLSPSKVADVIIWMLNAEWWVLVLGINNWVVENLRNLENTKLNDFRQITQEVISPPSDVQLEEIDIDGNLIFIYHINSDKERVFSRKDNERVFLRNGDETKELNREWVSKLEYDKSIRRFEEEQRPDFDESDFRESVLDFYKKRMSFDWDFRDLLVYRNLATKQDESYIYKNSAILLFAENPEKYIPSASMRYVRYDGNKQSTGVNLNVIKDERFEGCIPRIIELSKRFLQNVFRDYYYLNLRTGKFVKIPEYPKDAWLEGTVNALTHRSYNLQWNVIYIKHFDDRIEISNSGPLPSMVTVENIKETRFSRNPRIARVLLEMGYVRELNEWVNRIYDSMKESFLSEPEYIDKNDIVTLILRNNVFKNDDAISEKIMREIERIFNTLNESQKILLNFLIIQKKTTVTEASEWTGISEKMTRWYLNQYINDYGIMQRESDKIRDKNAVYRLRK